MKVVATTLTSLLVAVASVNLTFAVDDEHHSLRQKKVIPGGFNANKVVISKEEAQKQNNPCLVLIKIKEYEDGPSEETLACKLDEDDQPGQPKGYGKRIVDITGMSVKEFESLGHSSGNSYLSSTASQDDNDGEELYSTQLKLKQGKFKVEPAKKRGGFSAGSSFGKGRGNGTTGRGGGRLDDTGRRRGLQNGTDNRKTLVVKVIAADFSYSATTSQLSDDVFGTSNDPVNLRSQFMECSNGIVDFYPATSADDSLIADDGTMEVTIGINANGNTDENLRNAVISRLDALIPNWDTTFEHTMFCLPQGTGDWVAYAYINWVLSVYNNGYCTPINVLMHEIGHNLGLGHSGEGSRTETQPQYNDHSCQMGNALFADDAPIMCFNGAKTYNFGWYDAHTMEIDPTATPLWTLDLVNPATYNEVEGEWVVIKIETDPGGATCATCYDYYVMFNRATGFNSGTREAPDEVLITEQADTGDNDKSLLLAKMSAGQSYTISNFGGAAGTYVTITVNSIDTSSSNLANISIVHSSSCTVTDNCDNGDACDGLETCNAGTGFCDAGTPLVCDNNDPCDGVETCNPSTGCVPGTPITCDASEAPSTSPSTSSEPSNQPSGSPSLSAMPSDTPSSQPSTSSMPSDQPSGSPSLSVMPSDTPSLAPSTSLDPSETPSFSPSTSSEPSLSPSVSSAPSTSSAPSYGTDQPSVSSSPSTTPSASLMPSMIPSDSPSVEPSLSPSLSLEPSLSPSFSSEPSEQPSSSPSLSVEPSSIPSSEPSISAQPSDTPSDAPSISSSPSEVPSSSPSDAPSSTPSMSQQPSSVPSDAPSTSSSPSTVPSDMPTTSSPTDGPTSSPTSGPTDGPTMAPTEIADRWATIYFTDFESVVDRRGWIDGGKDAAFSNVRRFDADFNEDDVVVLSSGMQAAKKGDKKDKKKKDKKKKDKKKGKDKKKNDDKPKANRVTMRLVGGSASSNMQKILDLSICQMVTVDFFLHTNKLEEGELFYFKMWDGVGPTPVWDDIKIWEVADSSGSLSVPGAAEMDTETAYSVTLSNIDTSSYTSAARIRFEFQGQKKNDEVYVDNVEVMCLCSLVDCPIE